MLIHEYLVNAFQRQTPTVIITCITCLYKKGEILKYTTLTLQVNKQMKGFLHFQMPFFTKYRNDNKEHKLIDDQNAFWFNCTMQRSTTCI